MSTFIRVLAVCLVTNLWTSAEARSSQAPVTAPVDLVIALDVSGSMDGLIDSAKQRLWDIVNELGTAQPRPRLRVAIITFGNPNYGAQSGYVRIDQPFSTDLDKTNQTLFSFQTDGGNEYVARAVHTGLNKLNWSQDAGALKIMFVAGNEAANQDPQFGLEQVTKAAMQQGVAVNTIYCGGETDPDAAGWRSVAQSTDGFYASINQHASAVANVATPMDKELADLNRQLNKTYLPFGTEGSQGKRNQLEQDEAVADLSEQAMASRAITKSSGLYSTSRWDLVDAVKDGQSLDDISTEALPEPMQALDSDERKAYLDTVAAERENVKAKIQALGEARKRYIEAKRAESAAAQPGLDDVMKQGLRRVAEAKGYEFEK